MRGEGGEGGGGGFGLCFHCLFILVGCVACFLGGVGGAACWAPVLWCLPGLWSDIWELRFVKRFAGQSDDLEYTRNYSAASLCILRSCFACGYSFFLTCAIFPAFYASDSSCLFDVIPTVKRAYITRNNDKLPYFKVKHKHFKNSFFPSTMIEWNKLDFIIRHSESLTSFKGSKF